MSEQVPRVVPPSSNNGSSPDSSDAMNNNNQQQPQQRKRRWDAVGPVESSSAAAATITIATTTQSDPKLLNRKNRWDATSIVDQNHGGETRNPPTSVPHIVPEPTNPATPSILEDKKSKAIALQASIAARLAALKSKRISAEERILVYNQESSTSIQQQQQQQQQQQPQQQPPVKKAKVYDWDVNITTPLARQKLLSEEKEKTKTQPVKVNPYLSHTDPITEEKMSNVETQILLEEPLLDSRLAGGTMMKHRARNKTFHFIEPGTYQALAQRKREKEAHAIQSGFVSGRKMGTFIQSKGIATTGGQTEEPEQEQEEKEKEEQDHGQTQNYYGQIIDSSTSQSFLAPRADAPEESMDGSTSTSGGVVVIPMPLVMEWWDVELLPGKLKKEVIARESKALMESLGRSSSNHKKKGAFDKLAAAVKEEKDIDPHTQTQEDDPTRDGKLVEEDELFRLRQRCFITASIFNAKTSSLIQHPVAVKPVYLRGKEDETPVPTLYLTKKERKRQRKLRRVERQRELRDMQAVGLIPAPEPRLTLSNFIKVLGDQAILDPSKMEAKVLEQMQARKLKHEKMNAEHKLTDEQRKLKKTKKLMKDDAATSDVITVALFLVKDMSHRYHRTKVDLNAQQNQITGGVLECASPAFSLVICEGGSRAVRRYTRLMLERMKWKGENMIDSIDEPSVTKTLEGTILNDDDCPENNEVAQKFNPDNYCELVWTGMAPKRMFNTFAFQSCASAESARKVLEAKGVAHFWDQVVVHANGMGETFNIRLG